MNYSKILYLFVSCFMFKTLSMKLQPYQPHPANNVAKILNCPNFGTIFKTLILLVLTSRTDWLEFFTKFENVAGQE